MFMVAIDVFRTADLIYEAFVAVWRRTPQDFGAQLHSHYTM